MNQEPTLRPARSATERVIATVRQALRVAGSAQFAVWRDRLARRREVRAIDGIAEMNEYMLKDIGAWMISRAAMLREPHPRLAIPLLAATLITAATLGWAGETIGGQTSANPTVQAQWVGVFTGEFANGVPVYRLPPVTVSANRNVELAKMKREQHLAHSKQQPSKFAARPPA